MITSRIAAAGLLVALTLALPAQGAPDPQSAKKKPDMRSMMTGQSKPDDQKKKGVHYKNCEEVKRAGKAPIRRGQPGYGKHLDPDGDGVGCQ